MKENGFITANEKKVTDAIYYVWFAIGCFLLTVIISVLQAGGLKECISDIKGILIIGAGGAVLFLGIGAITWIQGMLAQRERKQIMKNGHVVTAIVTDVEVDMVWAGRGRKTPRYHVVVNYQKNGQDKTWRSPRYCMNPYDFVGLQQECIMYVWEEKCCLADVQKRKQQTLDELMGEYVFLKQEKERSSAALTKHCVFREGKKEGEIIPYAKVKDLDIRYQLEAFKNLDEAVLDVAKDEWSQSSTLRTDAFLRFIPEILRQAKPIGHFEVFLEVRFISKRICSFSTRYAIEQDFDALIKELNFQYTEKDYDFLKSHIQSRMEESAKRHFGRIPVTEVVVELL